MLHVIKFEAPWCGKCKQLDAPLQELVKNGHITIAHVNVEEHPDSAKRMGVRSLPTLIVQDGMNHEEIGRGSEISTVIHALASTTAVSILGDWDAS